MSDTAAPVQPAPFTFAPLTPTAFLDRSAAVFGDHLAVVDGDRRFSYAELRDRSRRLAGALLAAGAGGGERVAVFAPNSALSLEAHHGVPWAGAVLVPLNTRINASEIAYILDHAGVSVLLADSELAPTARAAAAAAVGNVRVIEAGGPADAYEDLLAAAEPTAVPVRDEYGLLSVNYTSGTTGRPKGVMYHHRGAYLQALAMAFHNQLTADSVYLWTLPMFHCSGWCFTWGVTAAAARHVCLRKVEPDRIWHALREQGVTHFSAAPTILSMLGNSPLAAEGLDRTVEVTTGGAPPSPALLARMADLGVHMTHLYGLTETYGPAAISEWHREWDQLDSAEQAVRKARQGVCNVIGSPVRVLDAADADVPADGATMGEIALRGNNVMLGYYRDAEATAAVTADGHFRTGDLGVLHPDGYVELRDRSKDVIISGGENIASVEVERALESHPAVLEAAVIGVPDDKWGEMPVAYVTLRAAPPDTDTDAVAAEILAHVRDRIAHFKAPKRIIFGDLPKTSTGKIQKYELRSRADG